VKVALAFVLLTACAGPVEVVKVASPQDAVGANGTKLKADAILRGEARAALPDGVTIHATKDESEAIVPRPGEFTYALDEGETPVKDDHDRVVGVKSGTHVTKFIPGTARVEDNAVIGELEGHAEHVALYPGDRIELRGIFQPHEDVPLHGKIEVTRAWSALVFGGVLLGGAWLTSVIVGATSGLSANQWLFVPFAGPFAAYAARDACTPTANDPTSCFEDGGTRVALAFDGALQITGLLLMIIGLPTTSDVQWSVTPTLGGLSLHGAF